MNSKVSQSKDNNSFDELKERIVSINRVTKVVKGGRVLAFSVLVVVGDGKGRIGVGKGKAKEVPLAVQKAVEQAKNRMTQIVLNDGTFYHEVKGAHGASKIMLMPAPKGTGIIAGGAMRAVFEVMGVSDVLAKCHGSTNPHNTVHATLNGLSALRTPQQVASKRGKPNDFFDKVQ
ncbi:MAG: 30S ribosomal protein S5 [Pseudomonadota bacterium]